MSKFGLPVTKFHIICPINDYSKGKSSTNPRPGMCTPIVFNEDLGSGDFEHWLLVQPDPSVDRWGFQNVASKNWASAQYGLVVGCLEYNPQNCTWLPIRREDGTYHVQLVGTNKIWEVNEDNMLALIDAYEGIGKITSTFVFPADGVPFPPVA